MVKRPSTYEVVAASAVPLKPGCLPTPDSQSNLKCGVEIYLHTYQSITSTCILPHIYMVRPTANTVDLLRK